jgi:hypothetical protein
MNAVAASPVPVTAMRDRWVEILMQRAHNFVAFRDARHIVRSSANEHSDGHWEKVCETWLVMSDAANTDLAPDALIFLAQGGTSYELCSTDADHEKST